LTRSGLSLFVHLCVFVVTLPWNLEWYADWGQVIFYRKSEMAMIYYPCLRAQSPTRGLLSTSAKSLFSLLVAFFIAIGSTPASAQDDSWKSAFGDASELLPALREEVVSIALWGAEAGDKAAPLVGTLYQPVGGGPFPVVVLSHGSPGRAADRKMMGRYRVIVQIKALVDLGFAVLVPMRRGYGESPADYAESFGSCQEPRYEKTGAESARDLRSAVAYVRSRPSLDATKIVLMGQSAGGFASIAAGSLALDGVAAVVNFAGGRGGNGINGVPCRADLMAQVIAGYAKTTHVPVLWFYVENDKYFGPATANAWFAAFQSAGGAGKLMMHPPYGNDGHLLFYTRAALPIWVDALTGFLKDSGLAALLSNRQ
jgi:dienelactone hydrolase